MVTRELKLGRWKWLPCSERASVGCTGHLESSSWPEGHGTLNTTFYVFACSDIASFQPLVANQDLWRRVYVV